MSGSALFLDRIPGVRPLAARQRGVVSRAQLTALGVTPQEVDHQVRARRWRLPSRDVVVLHRGPLDRRARLWAAVRGAPPGVALGCWTALELRGLCGWFREPVHIVISRGERADRHGWLVVHESRRPVPADVAPLAGLPVHQVSRAAVDAAAWQPSWRTAAGLLAAVVQQGLVTTDVLLAQVESVGAVRHRTTMRHALVDIAGGADSLAEIDLGRLCRRAGLPPPRRQVRRRDARGRWRFLDAEWRSGAGAFVVEVDGVGHMDRERWYGDRLGDAEIGADAQTVRIRIPAMAARREPERVAAILRCHLSTLGLVSAP